MWHDIFVFFGADRYNQHAICLTNDSIMMLMYVVSEGMIGASYYLIAFCMFCVSTRPHMIGTWLVEVFVRVFPLFIAFIALCGTTHWTSLLTLFQGVYRLDIIVMMLTAAVSAGTAWKVAGDTYRLLRSKKPRGQ